MRALVGCEFSGIVRSALRALGVDAWSCDLLPAEDGGPHILGDVRDHLEDGWDFGIFHPPCTHLAVSGARWFKDKRCEQAEALDFVRFLMAAPFPYALENPISVISSRIRKPDQIIQPWQFGHPETKATWLMVAPRAFTASRHRLTAGRTAAAPYPASRRQWPPNGRRQSKPGGPHDPPQRHRAPPLLRVLRPPRDRRVAGNEAREMRLVIVESPYAGDVERNLRYLRACLQDCLKRGEAPFASHGLYTQPGVLDDTIPEERQQGIDAGLAWGQVADASVVYTDCGMSRGMHAGIQRAHSEARAVEYRSLPGWSEQAIADVMR